MLPDINRFPQYQQKTVCPLSHCGARWVLWIAYNNSASESNFNKALTEAAARIATAKGGVAKAKQDHEKVLAQCHAFEATCTRLEAQQQEANKHLDAARMQLQADQEQLIALEAIGEFAAADVTIAECELALAQAKAHVAAFDRAKDTSKAGSERASLEQKVKDAEDRLAKEKERLGYNNLQKKHEEAKAKLKEAKGQTRNSGD